MKSQTTSLPGGILNRRTNIERLGCALELNRKGHGKTTNPEGRRFAGYGDADYVDVSASQEESLRGPERYLADAWGVSLTLEVRLDVADAIYRDRSNRETKAIPVEESARELPQQIGDSIAAKLQPEECHKCRHAHGGQSALQNGSGGIWSVVGADDESPRDGKEQYRDTRKFEELLQEMPFGRNVQRSIAERRETTFHIRRRYGRRSVSCDTL